MKASYHALKILNDVPDFQKPTAKLEQYKTSADMTLSIMMFIDDHTGIEGKQVADLGMGTGILSCGALLFDAERVVGVEIDEQFKEPQSQYLKDADNFEIVIDDVCTYNPGRIFDLVIMNPPFGTKAFPHIDQEFVVAGERLLAPGGKIYSIHKDNTVPGLIKAVESRCPNLKGERVAVMKWKLEKTYSFQTSNAIDIRCGLVEWSLKDT